MSHVLVISHSRGMHGAEVVMLQAIRACRASGAQVTVVMPSVVPSEGLDEALEQITGVRTMLLPYRAGGIDVLRTTIVQLYNIPTLRKLKKFVEEERVSVIYSNTTLTVIGATLARITGVRHVWHWHEPVDERFGWHESLELLYPQMVQRTDAIVCISRHQQEEWEQALKMKLHNARVVYNPIKKIVSPSSNRHALHKEVRIGYIGHFEERKNIELLVRVFDLLHEEEPDTRLVLCGAIDERDRLYVECMTDLQEPVMTILPQTPDVAKFYSEIDILVLPSWRETMPLVVLEAMQAGVCVLQTNQSGMTERVEDGKETLFFPPDRPYILLELLEQCMDADYRARIAKAGQEKAMKLVQDQSFDKQIKTILCV